MREVLGYDGQRTARVSPPRHDRTVFSLSVRHFGQNGTLLEFVNTSRIALDRQQSRTGCRSCKNNSTKTGEFVSHLSYFEIVVGVDVHPEGIMVGRKDFRKRANRLWDGRPL